MESGAEGREALENILRSPIIIIIIIKIINVA